MKCNFLLQNSWYEGDLIAVDGDGIAVVKYGMETLYVYAKDMNLLNQDVGLVGHDAWSRAKERVITRREGKKYTVSEKKELANIYGMSIVKQLV